MNAKDKRGCPPRPRRPAGARFTADFDTSGSTSGRTHGDRVTMQQTRDQTRPRCLSEGHCRPYSQNGAVQKAQPAVFCVRRFESRKLSLPVLEQPHGTCWVDPERFLQGLSVIEIRRRTSVRVFQIFAAFASVLSATAPGAAGGTPSAWNHRHGLNAA